MTESTNNTDMAAVLRRIQKMLAIANDGRGDANEAANAAQMAEKMMRKFQLDHADVIQAEVKSKAGAMQRGSVFANMKRDDAKRPAMQKNPSWGQHLAVALARLNDCEVRQSFDFDKHGKHSACLQFFGYHADVLVAVWMFDYLVGCVIVACKVFNDARRKADRADKSSSEAFRKGFLTVLTARLYEQVRAKEAEAQAQSTSRALVLCKKTAIVEAFGSFGYRQTQAKQIRDRESFQNGMHEARKVDLNRRGLEGSAGSSTLSLH